MKAGRSFGLITEGQPLPPRSLAESRNFTVRKRMRPARGPACASPPNTLALLADVGVTARDGSCQQEIPRAFPRLGTVPVWASVRLPVEEPKTPKSFKISFAAAGRSPGSRQELSLQATDPNQGTKQRTNDVK